MFSVGDNVIHCAHGAGIITEKKKMQITDTPKQYLVIQMLGSDSTLMVPVNQAEERLRPACERTELQHLLMSELSSEPEALPQDYKQRTKHLESKIKSGQVKKWIGVVRDLMHRDEQRSLSEGDQKLLDRAMDLLSGELALAQGISQAEAMPRLRSMIQHRHELADHPTENTKWWRTLGQKVTGPFAKSSMGGN